MMRRKKNDSFLIGLLVGGIVPVVGYWGIGIIFETLTSAGIMDEVTFSTYGKRAKTLYLLAICTNIIPTQLASNLRYNNILRGAILATLLYAGAWVLHFYAGVTI